MRDLHDLLSDEAVRQEPETRPAFDVVEARLRRLRTLRRRRFALNGAALVAAVAVLLVATWPRSDADRVELTTTPTPTPSVSVASLPLDKSEADLGLSFRYPSAWREYPYPVGFSFTTFVTFLSTTTVPMPCVHTAEGLECSAPPQVDLAPGGVLIWFAYAGRPPHEPEGPDPQLTKIPGSLISVDGHDARINVTAADPLCSRDGGVRSMTLTVARGNGVPDDDPLVVNGCFAGPDTSAAEATMRAMVATIKLSSGGASSIAPTTS